MEIVPLELIPGTWAHMNIPLFYPVFRFYPEVAKPGYVPVMKKSKKKKKKKVRNSPVKFRVLNDTRYVSL